MKINNLSSVNNNLEKEKDLFSNISNKINNKAIFDVAKFDRKIIGYTGVLTLPLILAACGGGGGGGAVSTTPTTTPPPPADQAHSDITVASSATSVDEGGSVTYTVTAGTVGNIDTKLSWNIAGGSSDFDSASGDVTLTADSSSATFTVSATDDTLSEDAEAFTVSVTQDSTGVFSESLTISLSDKTVGTQANAGNYTATSGNDVYLYDVKFASDGSVTEASDGNVIITGFDASTDSIILRGDGAPGSNSTYTTGGSTNVDVASDINGDTIITIGGDNDKTSTITLKGVSDSSSVKITSINESADSGSPKVDLSSGTVTATSTGEIFEYSAKFLNGVPVAKDGDVTIDGFDAATDRIVIKTETLPSGFGKASLLGTTGVDVTTGIDSTRIDFGADSAGNSGSIVLAGITDADLSDIDLTFEIIAPTIEGTRVDISDTSVTASSAAETFVYEASWDGDEVVGSDGDVTIDGFNLSTDKLVILTGSVPSGYDRSQFEGNTLGTQQIVVDAINNKTVIYFAPDSDGNSSTLTLNGVADESNDLNLVFGSSIGDTVAAPAATDTSTDTTTDTSTDTTTDTTTDTSTDTTTDTSTDTTTDTSTDTTTDTSTDTTTDTTTTSYTVVSVDASADETITATSAAEDFRYEIDAAGVSKEGAFTVTVDGFDIANDKLTLVIVGGSSNLTTQEFDDLSGVEVTSDGLSGTQIFFATDSDGQSGTLVLTGVEESFDSTWTASTYTVEILADVNLTS